MKFIKRIVSFVLVLCLSLGMLIACTPKNPAESYDYEGKNLIYIIGDGMGFNHIENTKLHSGIESFRFENNFIGEVTTRSADEEITDSAAAATALATGIKTNNDYVGVSAGGNTLENIMELSKKYGRKTAVVTTDVLNGATPAGFSAHVNNRKSSYDIIDCQLVGSVDLFLGNYDFSYRNVKKKIANNGYAYAETLEELAALSKDGQIIGNIQNVDSAYNPELTDAVPLKALVEYALDYLTTNNDKAFTLMVEGAYIDKHSHNNDLNLMMYAMLDLNDAIEYILDWAKGREDTVIIFTADHETGGLGLAESKDALVNSLYTDDYHTAANVPLYLFNVNAPFAVADNTDIYKVARYVVTGKTQ